MVDSTGCTCGQAQTVKNVAEECPLTRFRRGIDGLHETREEAREWLKMQTYADESRIKTLAR